MYHFEYVTAVQRVCAILFSFTFLSQLIFFAALFFQFDAIMYSFIILDNVWKFSKRIIIIK